MQSARPRPSGFGFKPSIQILKNDISKNNGKAKKNYPSRLLWVGLAGFGMFFFEVLLTFDLLFDAVEAMSDFRVLFNT